MKKKERDFYRKKLLKMREDILNKAKKLKEDSYNLGTDGIQDMADAASNTYTADILMSISDNTPDIRERIDPEVLTKQLRTALNNVGIYLDFEFSIRSAIWEYLENTRVY